jgi:hypothetical protein
MPPVQKLPPDVQHKARAIVVGALSEVTTSAKAVGEAVISAPREGGRLRRFGHGLRLPFTIARAVLASPTARRRYLRTVAVQGAITLAVGLLLAPSAEREEKFSFFSKLYATLLVVEWVVLALSRDFQNAIGREASLCAGVPPDDDEIRPKVRIDFKWLRKKLRDKIRGALVFAALAPLSWMLLEVPRLGRALSAALFVVWGIYWSGVFTASRTGRAWAEEKTASDPAFLRWWDRWTDKLPPVISWGPRIYGRIVRRFTRALFSPAGCFERSPWELLGLALGRTVRYVPVLNLATRPLFPVGAMQIVLAAERSREAEEK